MLRRLISIFAATSLLCVTGLSASSFLTSDEPDFKAFTVENAVQEQPPSEQPAAADEDPVQAEILSEDKGVLPGRAFWIALKVDLGKDWHTYWKNPGETGLGTSIDWHLPFGFEVAEVEWPAPKRFVEKSSVAFGYDESFVILAKVIPSKGVAVGQQVQLGATIRWVACNHGNCIPGDTNANATLQIVSATPPRNSQATDLFAQAREKLPNTDWKVAANSNISNIELILDKPEGLSGEYGAAYFMPLEAEVFNARQSLPLTPTGQGYKINLGKLAGKGNKEALEGVLLLQPAAGSNAKPVAVAIQADIKDHMIADASGDIVSRAIVQEEPPYTDFEGGLGLALVMAFVGGMILNLMPCVLPVISLKVLSIIKMSGKSRMSTLKHGLMFSAGVLVSFWILAGALLMLQAYGHAVGWGFQLQEPIFVAILAAVLLILAMSLFGVFEMGTTMASWAGETESQNNKHATGLFGSFFNGILATAVATPCTGPFLGSAIGFAVTLPAISALTVFTFLGLGMAFPYFLLTAFPSLVKWLPKPGNWMITFKQIMGFLLIATILWLLWVFGAQTDYIGVFLLLCALFVLTIGCWVYGRCCTPFNTKKARRAGAFLTIGFALVGTYLMVVSASIVPEHNEKALAEALMTGRQDPKAWLPFSPDAVEQFRAEGKPVFIDFTAKWCVICQTNHFILALDDMEQKFADLGIVKFKADWTKPDPAITKELRKFGRNGVPLYLLYAPGASTPMILPQVLTPDVVTKYLDQMRAAEKSIVEGKKDAKPEL
jgi:thiol:disulfide interchange protein/DsbC/DsbD-like thiol-disulfide interchange protein